MVYAPSAAPPPTRSLWGRARRQVSLKDSKGLYTLRSRLDAEEAEDQDTLRRKYESHRSCQVVERVPGEVAQSAFIEAKASSASSGPRQARGIVKVRAMLKLMRAETIVAAEGSITFQDKSGWLERETLGWISSWSPCWVTLRGNQLRWFHGPEEGSTMLGLLDLDLVPCEVSRDWDSGVSSSSLWQHGYGCDIPLPWFEAWLRAPASVFRIRPLGSEQGLAFRAGSIDEGDAWATALEKRVEVDRRSKAAVADLSTCRRSADEPVVGKVVDDTSQCPHGARPSTFATEFWKVRRITPAKFSLLAKTGDVLLFRSPGAVPRLIRATSGGRFDHTALVLRLEGGRIGLLEATGIAGVAVCAWDDFISREWFLIYPEIAWRRVSFARTQEQISALQTWAASVLGKPYGLSMAMLMQRKSLAGGARHESFFCSMLVAEALKVLQVIPHGKSSTQYWPASFEAHHRPPIETIEGTSLDEEMVVDFGGSLPMSATGAHQGRDATARLL